MAKIKLKKITCAHCGKESEQYVVLSSCSFGAMDLDTRPAAPARFNLQYEVQECPHCHYCNYEIAKEDIDDKDFSPNYLEVLSDTSIAGTVKKFVLAAQLYKEKSDYLQAGILYLKASWACDDNNDSDLSVEYRKLASESLKQHVDFTDDGDAAMVLVDVLRRCGQFVEAQELIKRIGQTGDETLDALLQYQENLIRNKDTSCHNMEEISK